MKCAVLNRIKHIFKISKLQSESMDNVKYVKESPDEK